MVGEQAAVDRRHGHIDVLDEGNAGSARIRQDGACRRRVAIGAADQSVGDLHITQFWLASDQFAVHRPALDDVPLDGGAPRRCTPRRLRAAARGERTARHQCRRDGCQHPSTHPLHTFRQRASRRGTPAILGGRRQTFERGTAKRCKNSLPGECTGIHEPTSAATAFAHRGVPPHRPRTARTVRR